MSTSSGRTSLPGSRRLERAAAGRRNRWSPLFGFGAGLAAVTAGAFAIAPTDVLTPSLRSLEQAWQVPSRKVPVQRAVAAIDNAVQAGIDEKSLLLSQGQQTWSVPFIGKLAVGRAMAIKGPDGAPRNLVITDIRPLAHDLLPVAASDGTAQLLLITLREHSASDDGSPALRIVVAAENAIGLSAPAHHAPNKAL